MPENGDAALGPVLEGEADLAFFPRQRDSQRVGQLQRQVAVRQRRMVDEDVEFAHMPHVRAVEAALREHRVQIGAQLRHLRQSREMGECRPPGAGVGVKRAAPG